MTFSLSSKTSIDGKPHAVPGTPPVESKASEEWWVFLRDVDYYTLGGTAEKTHPTKIRNQFHIVSAKGLGPTQAQTPPSAFVILKLGKTCMHRTAAAPQSHDPAWNENTPALYLLDSDLVEFEVYHRRQMLLKHFLGRTGPMSVGTLKGYPGALDKAQHIQLPLLSSTGHATGATLTIQIRDLPRSITISTDRRSSQLNADRDDQGLGLEPLTSSLELNTMAETSVSGSGPGHDMATAVLIASRAAAIVVMAPSTSGDENEARFRRLRPTDDELSGYSPKKLGKLPEIRST